MNLQVYGFYKDLEERIIIDWSEELRGFRECAWKCFLLLFELDKMIRFRQTEREKKSRRINSNTLRQMVDKKYNNDACNVVYDGLLRDCMQQGWKIHGTIIDSQSPKYPPDLRQDLKLYMAHAVFLREAFTDLYEVFEKDKEPLLKLMYHLQDILYSFGTIVKNTYNCFLTEEKAGDQGSKNQKKSDQKKQKLEALKLHQKYPELVEAIAQYIQTGKGRDQRVLNALFTEMTGVRHSQTRKDYRDTLIRKYIESQKLHQQC